MTVVYTRVNVQSVARFPPNGQPWSTPLTAPWWTAAVESERGAAATDCARRAGLRPRCLRRVAGPRTSG